MTARPEIDAAAERIRAAMALILEPGQVHEIRILHAGRAGTVSGYFDSIDKLAEAAARWDGQVPGIYWTANPATPALLARAANRLEPYARSTTSDSDILARRWLLIDLDPVRPAGISSTEEEHQAALTLAEEVREYLRGESWPEPVIADSGNGAHMLYRIDLPNDDAARELVRHVLEALDLRFSSEQVKVDLTTYNAARVWKLYGTTARKGDSTPERPHRIARILEPDTATGPESFVPVPREKLEELAATVPEPEAPASSSKRSQASSFNLADWMAKFCPEAKGPEPWQGGRIWIFETCPFNPEHKNRSAHVVERATGVIGAACKHAGCAGQGWHDLRDLREPGWREEKGKKRAAKKDDEDGPPTDAAAIANDITTNHHFSRDAGGGIYVYQGGVYVPGGDLAIRQAVKRYFIEEEIPESWSRTKAEEVVEYIGVDAHPLWESPPLDRINVRDGLLDWRAGELLPHDPAFRSPVQLPIHYDPAATCPRWDRFIEEVFPEDARPLAWEIAAWLMVPFTGLQKAILLVGGGGNGKSAFLRGLTAFLGSRNISSETLHRLEDNRFALVSLAGRLANICADLPGEDLASTSIFKALVGGDRLTAERKFKPAFELAPYARLVFSANRPPRSKDSSEGFFQRWLVVKFDQVFRGTKREIPAHVLDAQLADPTELSGLLNRALLALPGVLDHGLTVSRSMRRAAEEFRSVTDPVEVWLEGHVIVDPAAWTEKQALRSAYNRDAAQHARPAETDMSFTAAIRRRWPEIRDSKRSLHGRRAWSWLGIGLLGDLPSDVPGVEMPSGVSRLSRLSSSIPNARDPWKEGEAGEEGEGGEGER